MIRSYQKKDHHAVVHLMQLHTPAFFDPSEKQELLDYLANELEEYFVFELEDQIVGAGGINFFPKTSSARIAWDFVHPDVQGQGIGSQLVKYRLDFLQGRENVEFVIVRTSQLVYEFYEKQGFKLKEVQKDFWAEGYDLYLMEFHFSSQQ